MENYTDINSKTIDNWVDGGWQWGTPISHEEFENAKAGKWDVKLTPVKYVPHEWFGDLKGKKVLGLACGGGQQMPILTTAGASCTVIDYSGRMLDGDREVCKREGIEIEIVRGDITRPLPFEDESFDLIFHPVSNDYIEKVEPVFAEAYRVLKKDGVLMCGLSNELNYIVDNTEQKITWKMPFNPLVNPDQRKFLEDDDAGMQFSHTMEEQIGGQLKAGFCLTHILDDTNGEGRLHEMNIKTYILTRAVK